MHRASAKFFTVTSALALIASCSSSTKRNATASPTTVATTTQTTTSSATVALTAATPTTPATAEPRATEALTTTTEASTISVTTSQTPPATPPTNAISTPCATGASPTFSCFKVAVPIDPTKPSGATLNIFVTVRRADPTKWTSPILLQNQFAPGLDWTSATSATDYPGHDMVWIDQRGNGKSDGGAIVCPQVAPYVAEINTTTVSPQAVAAVKDCFTQLTAAAGPVPVASIFDHDIVANDIVGVRRALGIATWSMVAIGAATDIALRLIKIDGAAMTALETTTPAVVGIGTSPNSINEAFGRFAADCAANTKCAATGDLRQVIAKAIDRLKTPETTKTIVKETGKPVVLDFLNVQNGARVAMSDSTLAPLLPGLLAGLVKGDTDEPVAGYYATRALDHSPTGLAIFCQDSDYVDPGTKTSATDNAGVFNGFSFKRACDQYGPLPQYTPMPDVTGTVPVLAVVESYNSGSNVAASKAIFKGFPNTTTVEVPGVGNSAAVHDCLIATTDAFFADPQAKIDTTCLTSPAVAVFG